MPYITYSRTNQELLIPVCDSIAELFEDSLVVRRGKKSIKMVVKDALLKGFLKAIIIRSRKDQSVYVDVLKITDIKKSLYIWTKSYEISIKKNAIEISRDNNEAKEELISEASE